MFGYVDETGNTGQNIFDEDQPEYVTAALLTPSNFDLIYSATIKKMANSIGVDTLHANELGIGKIDQIALRILKLLKKSKASFALSLVEKKYLLATKVMDSIFDSGENPTVPWQVYNIRALRLMMTFRIATLLDYDLAKIFWNCLMERNEKKCRAHLVKFCQGLLPRVKYLPDQRTQNIVGRGLKWAIENPEALNIHTKSKHALQTHMPNLVAFGNLLDVIDGCASRRKKKVRKITHDEQNQFKKTLAVWHELFSNASNEEIHLPGEVRVLQKVPDSDFEIIKDEKSVGIQIIDIILWLYMRWRKGAEIPYASSRLLDYCMKKTYWSDFSFKGVGDALNEKLQEMDAIDISNEKLARGKEMVERSELAVITNTALYEEDKLLPFERGKIKGQEELFSVMTDKMKPFI